MSIPAVIPVYDRAPITFKSGKGSYLFSDSGDKYLDLLSGVAVNCLGHAHPELVKTLQKQAEKLWHVSNLFFTEEIKTFSQKIIDLSFADSVFVCNSGTEAIEGGVKAIRKYFDDQGQPEKYRIITFEGAFHGRTFAGMAATGTPKILEGFEPRLDGFDKVPLNIEAVKKAINKNTAAILIEPIQGEGGVIEISANFLKELRKICDENNLLLFFDEIQCGVARTGKLFAQEYSGVTPDLMTIAKGIGGGFPLGAFLLKEHVAKSLTIGSHGSTFGGNSLAMSVATKVLEIVSNKKFLENINLISNKLISGLNELKSEFPNIIEEVRGKGLLLGLKLNANYKNTTLRDKLLEQKAVTVVAGENVLRILPPLNINEEEVIEAIQKIRNALMKL